MKEIELKEKPLMTIGELKEIHDRTFNKKDLKMTQCKECSKLLIPLCTSCFRTKVRRDARDEMCEETSTRTINRLKEEARQQGKAEALKEVFAELRKFAVKPGDISYGFDISAKDFLALKKKLETKS